MNYFFYCDDKISRKILKQERKLIKKLEKKLNKEKLFKC